MPNPFFSKYGLKIAFYRAKAFSRGVFNGGRGGIKKRARLFSILAVFVIAGLIFSLSVYGLNLRGGAVDKTKISATVFSKIVFYDALEKKWKEFALNEINEIKALTFDANNNITYVTPTAIKKITVSNGSVMDLNYPGDILQVVDANIGNRYGTIVMEEDGEWYTSYNNGTWAERTISWGQASCLTGSKVKRVGQGLEGEMIALCSNGDLLVKSKDGKVFVNEGQKYNISLYGNVNSVDIFGAKRVLSTDKGYILSADSGTATYQPAMIDDVSPGNYIFESVQYNTTVGYMFTSAMTLNKDVIGFFQYSHTQNILILRATIPSCEVKISTAIYSSVINEFSFAATVRDACDPNNPIPPPPPGVPITINNTYSFPFKGISIHTKAENINGTAEYLNSATVKRGAGHKVKFTLTVTNSDDAAKTTDVKFTLPAGFKYDAMVSGSVPKADSCSGSNMVSGATNVMYWCAYSVNAKSEKQIIFNTLAP